MSASCASATLLPTVIGSWSLALAYKPTYKDAGLDDDPEWETWERLHREPCQELDEQGLLLVKSYLQDTLTIITKTGIADTVMVAALYSKTSFIMALVRVLAVGICQPFRPPSASGTGSLSGECPDMAVQGISATEEQQQPQQRQSQQQQQPQPAGQASEQPYIRLTSEVLGLAAKVTVVLLQVGGQVATNFHEYAAPFGSYLGKLPSVARLPLKSLQLVNTLTQTGVLHSCSKQVAQMCSALQQLLGQAQAGAGGSRGGGDGAVGGGGCVNEGSRLLPPGLLADSIALVTHACALTHGVVMYACMTRSLMSGQKSALPAGQPELARVFMRSLAQQLQDTCIMEHLARGLLLLAACLHAQGDVDTQEQQQQQEQQHAREGAGPGPGASMLQRSVPWYVAKESWPPQHQLAQLALDLSDMWHTVSVLYTEHSSSTHARQGVRMALSRALSGTCAQHLALSLGVMGLRAVDGGPVYGLPVSYDMLRPEPLWRAVKKVEPGELPTIEGQLVLCLLEIVQGEGRVEMLPVLGEAERLEVLLRIGRAAARSAAAHAEAPPEERRAGRAGAAAAAAVGAAAGEAVGSVPGRKRLTAAAVRAMEARWWEVLAGAALHSIKHDKGPEAKTLGPLLKIPDLGPLTGGFPNWRHLWAMGYAPVSGTFAYMTVPARTLPARE